jgi:hypothetical protein
MKKVTATFVVPDYQAETIEEELVELAEHLAEHAMYINIFLGTHTANLTAKNWELVRKLGHSRKELEA